jgi:EAL domain-containing protein (putative c-di-GMP-specific phosphodiesterase class I)
VFDAFEKQAEDNAMGCEGCRQGEGYAMAFSMAFQPIVDISRKRIYAYEALVRGPEGQSAGSVLAQVDATNRYAFDQQCRVRAIELAAQLYPDSDNINLSINFMPNAVYEPRACIRLTLATAERVGFPLDRIIFEFTEDEKLDTAHVLNILETYKKIGFKTAIDDFGAGYAGLGLLTKFQPDIVKLDMDLVRGIDSDSVKQTVVKHTLGMLQDLGITPLCEGIESAEEAAMLQDLGVDLIQGYYFAKPAFEALPVPAGYERVPAT